jgi:hypothetical protein
LKSMKRKGVFLLSCFFFICILLLFLLLLEENGIGHTLGIKLLLVCTCSTHLASIQHICSVYFVTIKLSIIIIIIRNIIIFAIIGDVGYYSFFSFLF